MSASRRYGPVWALAWPLVGAALLAVLAGGIVPHRLDGVLCGIAILPVVFAAVHHAEIVAHRIGEPFGTLVLAVAVTIIEVALIVALMLKGGADEARLARDTVFAAVMITCAGIAGLCLLAGGVRHHTQGFQLQGALSALAVLAALTVLTLIVPNVTVSTPGPTLNTAQLVFAALTSLVLYGAFVFIQTVRHRDQFVTPDPAREEDAGDPPAGGAETATSAALLLVSLVVVVGLAKVLAPTVEALVEQAGVPHATVGIVIAALVLLPEGLAAFRAARRDRLQTSMNLTLGSALASIGLTVPAVTAASLVLDVPLQLGLGPKESVLLALTLLTLVITLGTGRTTVLQGIVHLSIFAAFVFYTVVP